MPLKISNGVEIAAWQLYLTAIRTQRAGGQRANQVTAQVVPPNGKHNA